MIDLEAIEARAVQLEARLLSNDAREFMRDTVPALIARVRELEAEVKKMCPWYPKQEALPTMVLTSRDFEAAE